MIASASGWGGLPDDEVYCGNVDPGRPVGEYGPITVHPVGCGDDRHNCLPIIEGWNYIVRLYRPHPEVAARHPGQLVVVACHAGVIESSLLLARLPVVGDMTGARLKLRTQHASLTTWEVDAGQWKLVGYNDGAHHLATGAIGGERVTSTVSGRSWMTRVPIPVPSPRRNLAVVGPERVSDWVRPEVRLK